MSANLADFRLAAAAIAIGVLALLASACGGDAESGTSGPSGLVNLHGTSQEVMTLPFDEALPRLNETLGFEVRVPSQIPAGGLVELTNLQSFTSGQSGAKVSVLRYTAREWKVSPGELMFTAMQSPRADAFSPLRREESKEVGPESLSIIEFQSGLPGESLYQFELDGMTHRWVFQFAGEEPPRTGAVVEAIRTSRRATDGSRFERCDRHAGRLLSRPPLSSSLPGSWASLSFVRRESRTRQPTTSFNTPRMGR